MEAKLIDCFGKPAMSSEEPRILHWSEVTAEITDVIKLFICGFVYTAKDGEYKRQIQNSPYRPPEKKAVSFKDLDSLLRDLQSRISAPSRRNKSA